jgi:citrate lyase subunit beta-like protein
LEALNTVEQVQGIENGVRINAVQSGLAEDDLIAVLGSNKLQSILIPKVQSSSDILFTASLVQKLAPSSNIKILASIESALGLININEIASQKSVDAVVFAAEDYCNDLNLIRTSTRNEMMYARQKVVTAAAAHGIQSIDLVCTNFRDDEILHSEAYEGRTFGFTGKQCIHPKQVILNTKRGSFVFNMFITKQVEVVQRVFTPGLELITYAKKIIDGYELSVSKGKGAFELDGKMIDMPVVKWAENILKKI